MIVRLRQTGPTTLCRWLFGLLVSFPTHTSALGELKFSAAAFMGQPLSMWATVCDLKSLRDLRRAADFPACSCLFVVLVLLCCSMWKGVTRSSELFTCQGQSRADLSFCAPCLYIENKGGGLTVESLVASDSLSPCLSLPRWVAGVHPHTPRHSVFSLWIPPSLESSQMVTVNQKSGTNNRMSHQALY